LVDLSARLREPGFEYKATLESEMQAAMQGGVTSWCARRIPIRCWTSRAWWKC
jgi:dihydroorotase-like cyclic amidohydrolase